MVSDHRRPWTLVTPGVSQMRCRPLRKEYALLLRAGSRGVEALGQRRRGGLFYIFATAVTLPKVGDPSKIGYFFIAFSSLGLPCLKWGPGYNLKYFELAGKLVGKCLYESALGGPYRQLVRARLTRSFLAQIIGLRVHYKYFEQDDPELYLTKIKYVLETDLDANDAAPEIYFCDDVYENGRFVCTHDLIPNGSNIRVRNSHKLQYLDLVAQWRLAARVGPETGAFLRGLALLVPDTLLAAFDETELELLLCGSGDLAPADWRAHAVQGQHHAHIQ
ncbi:hypothetical protein evm_004655 [Chilo suppressalis]|nr:hypothetical protein evm_004655 [Chilo suppressalis]